MSGGILAMMIGVSLFLGAIVLLALLWALKSGQFDDEEKFLNAVRNDSEEDLRDAVMMEQKRQQAKAKKEKSE